MLKRDSVLETCLADLEFEYDAEKKQVTGVKAGYTPLKIDIGYMGGQWNFDVLALDGMTDKETADFNYKNTYTVDETKKMIAETLAGKTADKTTLCFDRPVEVTAGRKTNVADGLPSFRGLFRGGCVRLVSENACVASVLQNGDIIGNCPGFAGMRAYGKRGEQVLFVVKVVQGEELAAVPILVNENNRISDRYRPTGMVAGSEYLLPVGCRLTKRTADAWVSMKTAAKKDGVELLCSINGYLTNKEQLLRTIWYAEKNGEEKAERRYMPQGCTEHHLGEAIDVFDRTAAFGKASSGVAWLTENAHRYGFLVREQKEEDGRIAYVHARFYGDLKLASLLHERNITLEEYFLKCGADLRLPE